MAVCSQKRQAEHTEKVVNSKISMRADIGLESKAVHSTGGKELANNEVNGDRQLEKKIDIDTFYFNMDYESLYTTLPKEPKKWLVQDVLIWLDFIELPQLKEKFSKNVEKNLGKHSIDGSILELLEDKDLEEELGITQKIVKKKLMNWLMNGLPQYCQFVKEIKESQIGNETLKEQQACTLQKSKLNTNNQERRESPTRDLQLQNSIKSNTVCTAPLAQSNPNQIEEEKSLENQQIKINNSTMKSEHQLVLQPMEGQQNNFYCVKECGAKIGRHSSNSILILEENISRYHAEVTFQEGVVINILDFQFYLADIGSTTGTYIKIQNKLVLTQGMLIELGSNLFSVTSINFIDGEATVSLVILEGPNQEDNYELRLSKSKPSVTIGRKNTVDISFIDDHHLSNQHARFYVMDNMVYIEDYSSTNGTWLRLSPEGTPSQPYPLYPHEQSIIRIGTTNQYLCQQNQINVSEIPSDSLCVICFEKERDTLYLPCKHNAACLRCSKNLQKCPICRVKIQEHVKIYKN